MAMGNDGKQQKELDEWWKKIDWSTVSDERIEFAYSQAVEGLKDTEEARRKLDSKSFLFASSLLAILGYLFANINKQGEGFMLIGMCIICLLDTLVFIVACFKLILPQKTYAHPLNPGYVIGPRFKDLPETLTGKAQVVRIKRDQLQELQRIIDSYNLLHENRAKWFICLFRIIVLVNALALLCYCIGIIVACSHNAYI